MNPSGTLLAIWRALVEMASFLPIMLPLLSFTADQQMIPGFAAVFICYLIGYALGGLTIKIYMEWLIGAAFGYLIAFILLGLTWSAIPLGIIIMIQTTRGIRTRTIDWSRTFPLHTHFVFVCSFAIFPLFSQMDASLKAQNNLIWTAGLFTLAVFFFRLNLEHLNRANLNRANGKRVPDNVMRMNRIATVALLFILVLVAKIEAIQQWLLERWNQLTDWLNSWLSRRPQSDAGSPPAQEGPSITDMLGGQSGERSELWKKIEQLFVDIFSFVIIIALVGIIVYLIIKIVIPAGRRWLSRVNQHREEEGYIDELERLKAPEWGRKLRSAFDRLTLRREPDPADNRARVRNQYKRMLQEAAKDGYEHKSSYTPIEAEQALLQIKWGKQPVGPLIRLYNRVRYGESDVSDKELQELQQAPRHPAPKK